MSEPDDRRPKSHPAQESATTGPRRRRWTFRSLELERVASTQDSSRLRVIAEAIRSRAAERGLRSPEPSPARSPDLIETREPAAPASAEDAATWIAEKLDELAGPRRDHAEGSPPGGFDPCRESPWWLLEGRSGP